MFSLAVEQLLEVEVPPRAMWIRMLMLELNRVSSHLLWLATNGLDVGAIGMMIYGWRERELILAFLEKVTGLRMNHNYIRPGGVAADLPDGWRDDVLAILRDVPAPAGRVRRHADRAADLPERQQGVGALSRRAGHRPRHDRPAAAVDRRGVGPAAATCPTWPTTRWSST